jgi:HEAT repeat protein
MPNFPASLRKLLPIVSAVLLATACSQAQQPPAPPTPTTQQPIDADASVVGAVPEKPKTPAQLRDQAWTMLTTAVSDDKHEETRVQALAALGLMGGNPRSLRLIKDAMKDKDIDIRVAAALAAGETKSPNVTTELRSMLDDKDPSVAFVAALTLWKMHDRSGEDVLAAVADGERKSTSTLLNGTKHSISKELHDPAAMAKYGATQGAYYLLGPFGIGLTAIEYLRKNGGDNARVSAIEAIAQNHTNPIRLELISATMDKDLGVRAAACKALARYHDKDVPPALAKVFDDAKPPVRLTAAAAYLVSTGAVPGSPVAGETIARNISH